MLEAQYGEHDRWPGVGRCAASRCAGGRGHARIVRDIIEASRYLVLATADAAGRPWSSPVYFAHVGYAEF